jgi:hypothetical protein
VTEALTDLFNDIERHWGAYLAALVALSGLTMSLIQAAKELLFLRSYFHRIQTVRWLDGISGREAPERTSKQGSELEASLLRVTSAGNASALYDAELEDVCVQLSAATQFLVDYPRQSPELLKAICRSAAKNDLELIIDGDGDSMAGDATHRQKVFDARNRVRALTHRSVEAFRLETASRWRRGLKIAAFVVSVLIAALACSLSGELRERPVKVACTALVAGILAPVARDLLAAVQQLRRS